MKRIALMMAALLLAGTAGAAAQWGTIEISGELNEYIPAADDEIIWDDEDDENIWDEEDEDHRDTDDAAKKWETIEVGENRYLNLGNNQAAVTWADEGMQEWTAPTALTVDDEAYDVSVVTGAYNPQLQRVTLPAGIRVIDYMAFGGMKRLTEISLPHTLTDIEDSAFYDCASLNAVNLPYSISKIGESAFAGCTSLIDVWIPAGVGGNLGMRAFEECTSLEAVWVDAGVTAIAPFTFCRCEKLCVVEMHEGLEVIDDLAFWDCTALDYIRIPKDVKRIGAGAFENCISLHTVAFEGIPEQIASDAFKGCTALESIYVPLDWNDALTQSVPELSTATVKKLSEEDMKKIMGEW